MKTSLLTVVRALAVASLMLVLVAGPATATESAPAGEADDGGKLTLPDTDHDKFGLIILGLTGLAVLGAGANAVKQYRGERPQADGSIRWR